jgi:thiol:disulfide interchange protein
MKVIIVREKGRTRMSQKVAHSRESHSGVLDGKGAKRPTKLDSASIWQRSRRWLVGAAVLTGVVALQWPMLKGHYYRTAGVAAPQSKIAWRDSFAAAKVEAKAKGKPILLVFGASWCPPCNTMKHEVWPDAAVAKVVGQGFVPLYVDVDESADAGLASQYGIRGIPAVLVVDAEGNVLRQSAYMSRTQALQFLEAKPS